MTTTNADDPTTIERPGPGRAPTAFRIWKQGLVSTTKGDFMFTAESAAAIMTALQLRAVRVPVDTDHLSLDAAAPLANRGAVGWHDLEARRGADGGVELWAVNCEWSDEIRAGLEAKPPRWKYFSPVFHFDLESKEINDYVSTAVTNMPATYACPALAANHRIAASRIAPFPQPLTRALSSWAPADVQTLTLAMSVAMAANRRVRTNAERERDGGDITDDDGDGTGGEKKVMESAAGDDAPKMTIAQVVETLLAIASDEDATPDERAKAKAALEVLKSSDDKSAASAARAATSRLASRERIDQRSGVRMRGGVEHRGSRSIQHTMTPREARAELARRGGAR